MRLEVSGEPCWLVSVLVVYLCRLSLPVVFLSALLPAAGVLPAPGSPEKGLLPPCHTGRSFWYLGSCWLCSGGRYSSELPEALGLAAG